MVVVSAEQAGGVRCHAGPSGGPAGTCSEGASCPLPQPPVVRPPWFLPRVPWSGSQPCRRPRTARTGWRRAPAWCSGRSSTTARAATTGRTAPNGEWVEVTNTTRRAVNLDGWTLSDSDGNRYRFDSLRLAGRSSVRVHTGVGNDTRTDVYQDRRNYIWSNRADTATLRNDRGRTVDSESWGRGSHH